MKKLRLFLVPLASIVFYSSAIVPNSVMQSPHNVAAQEQLPTRKVSLGGTLNQNDINYTLQLLNAQDVSVADQINVDGPMINSYLNDGSTAQTDVYSSAIIEPRQPGYGVQVQIITPQTILNVSASTYQNAAITSGATDVLIKIASVYPVTGEGALTGVYAIYDANGNQLNQNNIDVAQKEITLPGLIKERVRLNDAQINEMLTNIKLAITSYIEENQSISDEALRALIQEEVDAIASNYNLQIPAEVVDVIFNVMKEFAALETERLKDVIDDSHQESWNMEQAIDIFEFAMNNIHTPSTTSLPENYNIETWQEVSREGRTTILQYEELYYRFDKYEIDTEVFIGENPDNLETDYLVSYAINNNSRLILSQHNPPLLPVNNQGDPVLINEVNAEEFAQGVLFPMLNEIKVPVTDIDPDTGAFVLLFTVYNEETDSDDYLGAYRVFPDGKIDHLENCRLSGYPVTIPTLPVEDDEPYFDEAKAQRLEQFMADWGQAMEQEYQSYRPGQEGDMYGLDFPSEVLDIFAAGEVEAEAYWSEDGISNNLGDFAVVAAYSDYEHFFATNPETPAGAHFYLFTIVDGQPIVMYSQQNQGQPSGLVHFYQTENVALQQAFEQIVQDLEVTAFEVAEPVESQPEESTVPEETSQPEESSVPEETSQPEETSEIEETSQVEETIPPAEEDESEGQDENSAPEEELPEEGNETSVENPDQPVESGEEGETVDEELPESQTSEEVVEDEESQGPEQSEDPLFDANKESVLANFMTQWGQVMDQRYESFTPEVTGDMYGVEFPTEVISLLGVNNQITPAYWSEDGISIESGDYAIVAAYHNYQDFSEQNPEAPFGANYYLFALVNEEPIVLVSQQNQGQPDGLIHFQPTDNQALQSGFSQIIETGSFDSTLLN